MKELEDLFDMVNECDECVVPPSTSAAAPRLPPISVHVYSTLLLQACAGAWVGTRVWPPMWVLCAAAVPCACACGGTCMCECVWCFFLGVVCAPLDSSDENTEELNGLEVNECLVRLAVLYGPAYVSSALCVFVCVRCEFP
jgi:hypothetical protein